MVCAAYCQGVFKTAKDPGPDSSYQFNSRNHRNFKKYEKSKIAKNLIEDISYWENHKFDSDADAEAFGDKIHLSDEHVKNEQWLEKPAKVLKSIKGSLLIIDEALSNSKKDDVKSRLVAAKVSLYLDEFTTHISNINDKIK